ncbi:MAG: thiamine-monophosphate kinase [Verrucomicrobia bacterium]|nr:thiamine-monophosphate kinase [Verrucomicrobiota bacterium]
MDEFALIRSLTADLPSNAQVIAGAGDDCAVLELGLPDRWVLFKTDAVVEGVHFTTSTPPEKIGHKALARCLSDIAAMAGTPVAALITLGLPREFDPGFIKAIYRGMKPLAERHAVAIVGGETTTNPDRLLISVSVIGTVEKTKCPRRSGAKSGDAIFVTGELGGSLARRHLEFEPRLREARWLAEHFAIHALMDISDGLAGDLRHILRASHVGAELLARAIPISRSARKPGAPGETTPASVKPPLLAALTDGEDFELLFTVASSDAVALLDAWKKKFPELRLSCIGKILAEPGLRLRESRGVKTLNAEGYIHFKQP